MNIHWRSRIAPCFKQELEDRQAGKPITTTYHRGQADKCGVGLARYLQMRAAEKCLLNLATEYPAVFKKAEGGNEGEARTILEIQKALSSGEIDEVEFKKRLGEFLSGNLSRHEFWREQNKKEVNEDDRLVEAKRAFRKALKVNTMKWLDGEYPYGVGPFDQFAVCHSKNGTKLLGVSFLGFQIYFDQNIDSLMLTVKVGHLDEGWIVVNAKHMPQDLHYCRLGIALFDGSKISIYQRPYAMEKTDSYMNDFIKRLIDLYRRI